VFVSHDGNLDSADRSIGFHLLPMRSKIRSPEKNQRKMANVYVPFFAPKILLSSSENDLAKFN